MKKYILDYSTWRCGDMGVNRLGAGTTALLNANGFMCCLGQFCIQEGAPKEIILNEGEPSDLGSHDDDDFFMSYFDGKETPLNNKKFNARAIDINDNTDTTPEEKIIQLQSLCNEYEVELEIINKPS